MQLTIPFGTKQISAFTFMAVCGVSAALVQSGILLQCLSLSWWLLPVMFVSSAVAFLFLALLVKVFTGKENHVMLRYFIVVLLINFLVMRLMDQPVLTSLDILAAGYGTIILFGRVGCFMVGCCHGKPNAFGVCYSHDHVKEGFTDYYSGVRLFPVQLAEAFGILAIVTFSIATILSGFPEGTTLVAVIALYGVLRFILEFFRGDPARPYFLSFSEAQWTVLLACAALFILQATEILPGTQGQMIVQGIPIALFVITGFVRMIRPQLRISEPGHVKEIMQVKAGPSTKPEVRTTSLGINISIGHVGTNVQYTLSANRFVLDKSSAHKLAAVLSIRHPQLRYEILPGQPGLFHVIFHG